MLLLRDALSFRIWPIYLFRHLGQRCFRVYPVTKTEEIPSIMKINFRKYTSTLCVFRDFELSFLWKGQNSFFLLTRIPSKSPAKHPEKKGWLTPEKETIQSSSIWQVKEDAKKIGLEISVPANWPNVPKTA